MDDIILLDEDLDVESHKSICDIKFEPTHEESSKGLILGRNIDTQNDEDNGLVVPGTTPLSLLRSVSDRESALAKARQLKRIMLEYGVPEVSIELQEGRPNSYGRWDALFPVSEMSHHTVSVYSVDRLTPCLWLIKQGRSDLPGPLSNGYGGYDLCYRIITFGYANHPGEGGPYTVKALTAGSFTIPKDSARRYAWGTEWEGGIREGDWDRVLTNPRNGKKMTMREFMGRSNAALEKYLEIHEFAHLEHSTWSSTGKIDRLNYTASKGIAEKEPYRVDTRDWFDMANAEDLRKVIHDAVGSAPVVVKVVKDGPDEKRPLQWVLRHIMTQQDGITQMLKSGDLADRIVAKLPVTSGVSKAQVQEAAEQAIRDVLGNLDE